MHARSMITTIAATFAALTALAPDAQAQRTTAHDGPQPISANDGSQAIDDAARERLRLLGVDPQLWNDAMGPEIGAPMPTPRGVTYTERWVYDSEFRSDALIQVDLEGDLVVARGDVIEKIDVTPNTVGDVGPVWNGVVQVNAFSQALDIEIDLDGNIYACGASNVNTPPRGVARISPSGFVMWERSLPGSFQSSAVVDIALSPDGVPFVVTGQGIPSIFRLDPNTGGIAWRVDLEDPAVQSFSSDLLFPRITVDRRGNLFALAVDVSPTGNNRTIVVALDGATGKVLWSAAPEIEVLNGTIAQNLITDFDCNLYICGSPTQGQPADEQGLVIGYDIDGNRILNRLIPFIDSDGSMDGYEVRLSIVESRPDGTLILAGRSGGVVNSESNAPYVTKLDANRNRVWSTPMYVPGTCSVCTTENTAFDDVFAIDFDRFGNVYCLNRIRTPSSSGFASRATVVERLNVDTGVREWPIAPSFFPDSPDESSNGPLALSVDNGSNVYFAVVASRIFQTDQSSIEIRKITQEIELARTRQTACAELKLENRSVWGPGVGNLVEDQPLFTFGPTESVPFLGEIWPIDFGLGGFEFGTGARLKIEFNGTIDTGLRAEIDGGTADVHLPFDIEWRIPNPLSLNNEGDTVTIETNWQPDPAARIITCVEPQFNAGLTAGGSFGARINFTARLFGFNLINENLLNRPTTGFALDYIPGFNLLDMIASFGSGGDGRTRVTIADRRGLLTGFFQTPSLSARGLYNSTNERFVSDVDPTDKDGTFLGIRASITESVVQSLGGTLIFNYELGNEDYGFEAAASLLQLRSGVDLRAGQRITVETVPTIRYTFPGTSIPDQVLRVDEDLVFPLPAGKAVDIVPFLETPTTFRNKTSIAAIPVLNFDAFSFTTAAYVGSIDIFGGINWCFACFDWDISDILNALGLPGDLVDLAIAFPEYMWSTESFPTVQLPCIRVVGNLMNTPRLLAASRAAVDMIIYDQTSPTVASFNVATEGTTRFLLYGDQLQNQNLSVQIAHNGAIETLTPGNGLTPLNAATLQVEMPNIMRLTPGVARIMVMNENGASETIDLAIEYPAPRLDAVNPNLWAADPELSTVPVSVIDAKSFLGNDTFIARRDYWILMRDGLWTDFTAGGVGAQDYFSNFNFGQQSGFDFAQLPGFPSVLWKPGIVGLDGLSFPGGSGARVIAEPRSEHGITNNFTIEAIIRPNDLDGNANTIYQIVGNRGGGNGGWRLSIDGVGRFRFTTWGVRDYFSGVGLVPEGVWSHVAVVFQNNDALFYVNGEFRGRSNFSNPASTPSAPRIAIGGRIRSDLTPNNFQNFDGDIAEVRLWDGVRSEEDLRTYVTGPLVVEPIFTSDDEPDLIGYWPLNGFEDFGAFGAGTPGPNDVDDLSELNAIADTINVSPTTVRVTYPDDVAVTPFPLSRFIQPVDNGIFNVRLTPDLYDRPQKVRVVLCNPGPGGGMSNEFELTIAAPLPVMSGVEPSIISPLDIPVDPETLEEQDLEITVRGPSNVPQFVGFEEPKRGNFNRDTVVFFNGQPLETIFGNADLLTAILPHELVTEGEHVFHVTTPSNGTQYFEQRFRDVDGDGNPDDEDPNTFGLQPFEQMLVDSGGVSNPVFFRVRYQDPVIDALYPETVTRDDPAFDADATIDVDLTEVPGFGEVVTRTSNLTITGDHFRPGATVYFNDEPRTAEVIDRFSIRVTLLPEDVDVVGTYDITVLNPGNPPVASVPSVFTVMPDDASSLGSRAVRKPVRRKPSTPAE